jgi:putative photosynthetic complex assembly protein 2
MFTIALAVFMALSVWWLSTGAILLLDRMGPRTCPRTLAGASVVLLGALYGIAASRNDTQVAAAYLAFACSVAAWGWLELTFLLGLITGPRRQACPGSCGGWRHFLHAIEAILYHEIAIALVVAAVYLVSWRGANHVALWSITILWLMRESAKLNLFLGVRNLSEELLPPHLSHLQGFFRRRQMNFLFPLSVTASAVGLTVLVQRMLAPGASDFAVAANALLATLTGLGLLEHWMLVLPFRPSRLWNVRERPDPACEAVPGPARSI